MRFIVIVVSAILSGMVVSVPAVAQYGQEYEFVDKVQVHRDGYLYIRAGGNLAPAHGCTEPWYGRSLLPLTSEMTKAQMQVALASFLSRSRIYIETIGCTGGGRNGNPIVTKLQVQQ